MGRSLIAHRLLARSLTQCAPKRVSRRLARIAIEFGVVGAGRISLATPWRLPRKRPVDWLKSFADVITSFPLQPIAFSRARGEILARLKEAGCLLAICSNKPQRLCHKVLGETGLIHFFGAIVGGDTFDKSKPDPKPLKHALSRLGKPFDAALMIGDSVVDQQTAMAAGVKFAFFSGGYDDGVDRLEADHVIDTLDELAQIVGLQRPEPESSSLSLNMGLHFGRGAVEQS